MKGFGSAGLGTIWFRGEKHSHTLRQPLRHLGPMVHHAFIMLLGLDRTTSFLSSGLLLYTKIVTVLSVLLLNLDSPWLPLQ